jgi:DNA-binding MarR family transcriptional regulator
MKARTDTISIQTIRALAEFRHRLREFLHFSETAAEQAGLQPQQHQLLLQIAGAPEGTAVTVGYVAGQLGLKPNSAVELCGRCEQAGFITREHDELDRRCVLLAVSARGLSLLHTLSIAHARELNVLAPELVRTLSSLNGSRNGTGSRAARGASR